PGAVLGRVLVRRGGDDQGLRGAGGGAAGDRAGDVAGGHLVGQVRLEDVAVVRGGAGVHQAVQIGLGDRHGVGGVAAGQVGVDADFSVIDHGEGRGRAGVVRGVDADLTEIEGLG